VFVIFRCRICGHDLIEETSVERCTYCGQKENADWRCPEGHYVCESCRTSKAEPLIERTCLASDLKDPIELAELILKHPAMPPYGAEHHILAAPVLLAALRNRGIAGISEVQIRQSIARLRDIPEMVCATRGDCGAAASGGTVVSLLRRATIRSDHERCAALRATLASLGRIADHGGPRCCRQSVFDTIHVTWELLREDYDLEPLSVRTCSAAGKLPDCKLERCPYHG
jgi:hypothetical protein